jgi:alkylation response protein AidB-like acyl-CoA dehydrogenase
MSVISSDELLAFVESLRRLLKDHSSEAEVRRLSQTPEGYDPKTWRALSALGVTGLIIDQDHGGLGAGPVELERIMEAVGASLLCSPLLSSAVLAPALLQALGNPEAKARLLPGLADGSRIATIAVTGPLGRWTRDDVAVKGQQMGDTWHLTGQAGFVTHAQIADTLLVLAMTPEGLAVFETDAGASGVSIKALPAFDHTLRIAEIEFANAPARRIESERPVWDGVQETLNLALIALAGEQAGGARHVLDMTVDYVKNRYQFGRAIGSFQAVKHMATDLLMESESCTSAARYAAEALAANRADAPQSISLAAFACADAYCQVTATSIQMHGGIAFTWAHPAHLYLRRARADAQLFGAPDYHRERYVQQLGG